MAFILNEQAYKKLMVLPIALLIVSVLFLVLSYSKNGEFLQKSIDLEGGVQIIIHYTKHVDTLKFEDSIRKELGTTDIEIIKTTDPATRQQQTLVISIGGKQSVEKVLPSIEKFLGEKISPNSYSSTVLGPALAGSFWNHAKWALVFAFSFMIIVIFLYFRTIYSSISIMISMFADIITIIGFMSFFGINLSLATIGAILMIIGYGVDSNILISTKVVKEREGTVFERIQKAMKTGLTMSSTTIASVFTLFVISNSLVLKEIAAVLLIGLVSDLLFVWVFNANLLLWHLKQ